MTLHFIRAMPRILFALACAPAAVSCTQDDSLPDQVIASEEPIIHGKASTSAQNDVVMLSIAGQAVCTGSLVAPNLVLTARHCVSKTDETLDCAPNGHAIAGGRITQDYDAQDIIVYTGTSQSKLQARARGAQLVHDSSRNLCNHDIAFIVLDRDVRGVPIAPLRLTESTRVGELITSVGWGLTEKGVLPKARMQRQKVAILDVGPSSQTEPNDLVVGESICSGDSGGPALSARGAVVGIVSRGGNGRFDPSHPASGCIGAGTSNVYTRLAPFKKLTQQAFREAQATAKLE